MDTSEDVPPGATPPAPLPVPATPIGGGRLGECGLVVPEGAPPLPSDISAGAWLIADLDTGEVLAAKDPHGRYRPASTLKLLTVQPLLKNLTNLDQIVEGTENDAGQDGTRVGIEAGGKYTVRQLLTYLIINSGNDAANALARTNGGYDKTIADMNATRQRARRAGHQGGDRLRTGRARSIDVGLRPRAVRQGRHGDAAVPGDRLQRRRQGAGRRRRGLHRRERQSTAVPVPGRAGRQDRIHRRRRQHLRRHGRRRTAGGSS